MTLTIGRTAALRIGAIVAIALALLLVMLRHDAGVDAVSAAGGSPISGKCTGQKQGVIKGDVTIKGREGTYAITSATDGITTPRDPQSGQLTGPRVHRPFVFTTNVSGATPQLISALTTNENLTSCVFNFWRTSSSGADKDYYRVALTNASVADYAFSGHPAGQDTVTFTLTYQKIQWTYLDGGITAADDWESPSD